MQSQMSSERLGAYLAKRCPTLFTWSSFGERDDSVLLLALNIRTEWYRLACPQYESLTRGLQRAIRAEEVPFIHERIFELFEFHVADGSFQSSGYEAPPRMDGIFPKCRYGSYHVPVWTDVIVRDFHSGEPLVEGDGLIQFLDARASGVGRHSVLTESMGRLVAGGCPCGREGKSFCLGSSESRERQ